MRCELGATPLCKVHNWSNKLELLRKIALSTGLTETLKWSIPCYTYLDKNVLTVSAFKNFAALSFFKGSLLQDKHGILRAPGKHSQASRRFEFNDSQDIINQKAIIESYIFEATEIEKAGLKVKFKKTEAFDIPDEFIQKLLTFPELKNAFDQLTPGRKRGYLLYFTAAKQAKTRISRIEKYIPKILSGKGFHD